MKIKIISIILIVMLALCNAIVLFGIPTYAENGQWSWPSESEWIHTEDDPNEQGCEDYKDVEAFYYHINDYYLYLRLQFYSNPNITEHDMRLKWFIDIDDPHNMGWTGNKVHEAEYLLFIEDSPKPHGDGTEDIYLIYDSDNDGFMNDETKNGDGKGYEEYLISDTDIAGFRIIDNYLDLYISQENISNPVHPFCTWTTDQGDPNLDSSSAHDQSDAYWNPDLAKADVSIEKISNKNPVFTNESFTYTLTVENHGPHIAYGYNITDTQPSGITFDSTTPEATEINGLEYRWYIPIINVGESFDIKINVSVNDGFYGTINNTAEAIDTYDPAPQNNKATNYTTVIKIVGLSIEKTSEYEAPAHAGTLIVYTINVTNHGPDQATNINITDTLPDGVTFNNASPTEDEINGLEYIWYIPYLDAGKSKIIKINATVNDSFYGTIVNTATIESDSYDPYIEDNIDDDIIVVVPVADISVNKTSEYEAPAHAGSLIEYTINVTNLGPSNMTDITVIDILPEGVTFNSSIPDASEINGSEYRWFIPVLNVSESFVIKLNVTVNDGFYGTIVNTATIEHDYYDPGNESEDNDTIEVVPVADINVNKTSEYEAPAHASSLIEYTINVTNLGPDNVTDITVIDILPEGVTFNSSIPDASEINGSEYRWFIPVLNASESFVIKLNVTVNDGFYGTIVNSVDVEGDYYDPNPGGDEDEIDVPENGGGGGSGGGGGGGSGGHYTPPDTFIDEKPTAIISGIYTGVPNEEIEFNGTESHDNDEDGYKIIRFDWKFSDDLEWQENLGATPTYIYTEPGIYNVYLRVIDDENNSDINTTIVTIIKPNTPPSIPEINGPENGTTNVSYNFTVVSTDEDGDELKYTIDWGDGTEIESEFLPAGTAFPTSHKWIEPGLYLITVTAGDNETISGDQFTIEINEPKKENEFPWLYLLLLLLFLILLLLIILEKRRRDKKKQKELKQTAKKASTK